MRICIFVFLSLSFGLFVLRIQISPESSIIVVFHAITNLNHSKIGVCVCLCVCVHDS